MENKYKIKVIKKYVFNLTGEDKEEVNKKLDTVMNESKILDLPYVNKTVKVSIKKIGKVSERSEANN